MSGKIVKNGFIIRFLAGLLASGYTGFTQASLNYATSIDINTASFSGTMFSVAAQDYVHARKYMSEARKLWPIGDQYAAHYANITLNLLGMEMGIKKSTEQNANVNGQEFIPASPQDAREAL